MPLVFVYGTLMRGECRHSALADERFAGVATTCPDYRLYDCGSYPGLVAVQPGEGNRIEGEVWHISRSCLSRLDLIEGIDEGLYTRGPVDLETSPVREPVQAYFYQQDTANLSDLGTRWRSAGTSQ